MKTIRSQSGFFLIEVIVATGVIGTVLIYLLSTIQNSVELSQRSLERTQASYLLEEGAEAIKAIRNQSWSTLASQTVGTTYYLSWSSTLWSLTTTAQTTGMFTRSVVFSNVYRDTNDDIVTTGGTLDAGTKKATITTTWMTNTGQKNEAVSLYITNFRG